METIKGGSTGQFYVAAAIVSYLDEKKTYEGLLYLQEAGKEKAKYFASDIRIFSSKKETVYKQLKNIAALYPPKTDINILDLGENV